ncbi:MAG TPA: radical SAM protein [Bacteroidales bacterium]|nr:radical SAM protein [Bacteroidales bacterium]
MPTFLFDKIIFGPVKSRRLGHSLGVNLLPTDAKVCNFNCIYCECGLNTKGKKDLYLPTVGEISNLLQRRLNEMKSKGEPVDTITFAGNGEPTMHPQFEEVIDAVITVRNNIFPQVKIAVLSNSLLLHKQSVLNALKKADLNIMKLDSAINRTFQILNQPQLPITANDVIENLKKFNGKLVVQTMFVKGSFNGQAFDNTTDTEIIAWTDALKSISPELVMIYTIARDTPVETIEKISGKQLKAIASTIEKAGLRVSVSE